MSVQGKRRDKVAQALPDGVDALLVTNPANVRYLTGFTGSNGQLLLGAESAFFTDGRYDEQSSKQVPDVARAIYSGATKLSDLLGKTVADGGVTKVGVEASHLTVATRDKLAGELSGIELVPTTDVVEKVRRIKDDDEVTAIRSAQRIAEQAVTTVLKEWTNGLELDLAMRLEWSIRNAGCEGVSFAVIVASGPHSALPHASPRREPVENEGVLLIDIGARRSDGYCSDMTRTYLGPDAPKDMVEVHRIVCDAVEAACEVVRPGVKCSDVDKAARDVISNAGYGDRFIHSTGHGVGLEIHEAPTLSTTAEGVLEAGMVITIEPGIYLPGVGGVRVEDLLVVTEDSYDNLTALPRGPEFPG